MTDDPYSILEVSRHATDAEIERAYERLLHLFDPGRYPGSTEDAYKRLERLNAAYAEIRGGPNRETAAHADESEPDDSEPIDEPPTAGREAKVADNLVRIGFISDEAARHRNPAVDVLAALLPEHAEIVVCLTCVGVKASGPYQCQERSGSFRAMTVTRRDTPYAVHDHVHPLARTQIVLCTEDALSWTESQYAGHGMDDVTLYSIPFTDVLGAEVRGRKHDVAEVWIVDDRSVSVHTRPHAADALCQYIEHAASSD